MKSNITLKIDPELLRAARALAAQEGRSVSAFLSERLEALVYELKTFDMARRRALNRLRTGLDLEWEPVCSRDEIH